MMDLNTQLVNGIPHHPKNATQLAYSKATIVIALVHKAFMLYSNKEWIYIRFFNDCGTPIELLNANKARVSNLQYRQLWIALANAMNDEFFGMDSHEIHPDSYKLLSKWMYPAEHLKTKLEDILKIFNLVLGIF